MFFYFCFTNKFGYDQVCWDDALYGKPGDLIESNGSHFLVLGETTSWQDTYQVQEYKFQIDHYEVICSIMGTKTLELVHWMVYQYYTSYKNIVSLFISDLSQYLKHYNKIKTFKKKDLMQFALLNSVSQNLTRESPLTLSHDTHTKDSKKETQTLIVFPDLLSLVYRCNDREYILSGKDTHSKVMKYYLDIQHGAKNILITTGANVCMDWSNLTQIIIYFPKTRYYKYRQDPRIWIPEVCEKMGEIWGAEIKYIEASG